MSREGKSTGGPPRLTVVEKSRPSEGAVAAPSCQDGDGEEALEGANDAQAGSPVHDLIHSIEAGAAAASTEAGRAVGAAAAATVGAGGVGGIDPERVQRLRVLEAVIFASAEPVEELRLESYLKPGEALKPLLRELQAMYAGRGVNLVVIGGKWAFRTAEDLSWALERHAKLERRLSKAALETLAIVAYHQPATRAEIEEVRGVTLSKGTLDVLMEVGWVRPRGRRRAPGKPITYGTTDRFLEHFGLEAIKDLPGLNELKASGLLDANLPPDFKVPEPTDVAALMPDELPLEAAEDGDEPLQGLLGFDGEDEEEDGGDDGEFVEQTSGESEADGDETGGGGTGRGEAETKD